MDEKFVANMLHTLRNERKVNNKNYTIPQSYLLSLTKEQINAVLSKNHELLDERDFFNVWLKSNHGVELKAIFHRKGIEKTLSEKE